MRQPVPFGKYLLLDRISVGGMAEVFKAKSYGVEGFEKIIAIKRILPTMGEDRDFIKMFIDEAKIAGQLAHANICQIFELGRIDGSHFIAMEYIWGKDLLQIQNRLRKIKQPMPVAMACFTMAKVLEGLDYAHRKRDPLGRPLEIVHRDCSPQNVLVSYEGEVKVIDFGIAKATSRNSRTMAGVLKGKFGYMSPEQVRGLPLDRRSDLFALGTMLYECLTSERLFQGETDFSTLEKVRNVDIQRPREINPNIPESVERVILKALAKDVDDRYQWCSEMLADLQQYLMSQDVVFTAKSLSSWLKEVFSPEIERERQQLEQYKRVGRDGLIAGVPAAEAKLDVVETLGVAPPAEGDPTMLGEPNFDDLERAVAAGAAPEVGPAPGSPAAVGHDEHYGGDFGEEAPTEIFGEIDSAVAPPAAAAAAPSILRAATQPPRPPPRPGTNRTPAPAMMNGGPMMPPPGPGSAPLHAQSMAGQGPELGYQPAHASPASGYAAQGYPGAPGGQPPLPGMAPGQPMPGAMPPSVPGSIPPPGQAQAKTLLGAAAPVGLPNYANYTPPAMSAQQPAVHPSYPPQGMHPSHPSMPVMPGMGSMPPGQPMPGQPMLPPMGQPHQPYPGVAGPQGPYGHHPYASGPAVETALPPEGRRRSSIMRDVAIGVAIAGLVLGGFLAVKFLVLDAPDEPTTVVGQAELQISMPGVERAELLIDNERHASVGHDMKIGVPAGLHEVKLVGPGDQECKQAIDFVAGETTVIECKMQVAGADQGSGAGSAAAGAGSAAAGSADVAIADPGAGSAGVGSAGAGSADPGAGSAGAGSAGSAAASSPVASDDQAKEAGAAADNKAPRPTTDKAVAKAANKAADKAAADKAAADKAAADKAAADRAKAAADKARKNRTPDNPADRAAAMPSKGWVQLTSKPSAKILVDGADTGLSTPITGRALALTPGKHRITFQIGGDKYTFSVMVKAGETVTLDKMLQ